MENLLTVKDFAAAAGVSEQAIYKRLNQPGNRLNNFLIEVEGQKRLDIGGLELFTKHNHSTIQPNHSTKLNSTTQPFNSTIQPTEGGGLTELQEKIDALTKQLKEKDNRISELQEQTAGQLQSIQELTAAIHELTVANHELAIANRELNTTTQQQQALTAGTIMSMTEKDVDGQAGASSGDIIEGDPVTSHTDEAREKQETNGEDPTTPSGDVVSDPAGETAPEHRKRSLWDILNPRNWKR